MALAARQPTSIVNRTISSISITAAISKAFSATAQSRRRAHHHLHRCPSSRRRRRRRHRPRRLLHHSCPLVVYAIAAVLICQIPTVRLPVALRPQTILARNCNRDSAVPVAVATETTPAVRQIMPVARQTSSSSHWLTVAISEVQNATAQ